MASSSWRSLCSPSAFSTARLSKSIASKIARACSNLSTASSAAIRSSSSATAVRRPSRSRSSSSRSTTSARVATLKTPSTSFLRRSCAEISLSRLARSILQALQVSAKAGLRLAHPLGALQTLGKADGQLLRVILRRLASPRLQRR